MRLWLLRVGFGTVLFGAILPWAVDLLPVDLLDRSNAAHLGKKDYVRIVATETSDVLPVAWGIVGLGAVLIVAGTCVRRYGAK